MICKLCVRVSHSVHNCTTASDSTLKHKMLHLQWVLTPRASPARGGSRAGSLYATPPSPPPPPGFER